MKIGKFGPVVRVEFSPFLSPVDETTPPPSSDQNQSEMESGIQINGNRRETLTLNSCLVNDAIPHSRRVSGERAPSAAERVDLVEADEVQRQPSRVLSHLNAPVL